ncbi:membrane protein DedA, SNARE-associated domain [Haladaptatus litoreus]|uniref:Membrane protein DedA, SNARE-associated domain n=1 Tax=Haladaptatus litoreus TaxID=553468 RepID=A0A1N6ZJ68_9EURY|nr:DedA family protein [Haladaptatus litoreus]SIR26814.1 membrane protein DedA, SNARE-associated domain [Haladaptatus litoreus]
MSGLTETALSLIQQYGFLAVFVFAFLESSMLFPLLPSELVVPTAAGLLVRDPVSFALFVIAMTVGTTVGSLLPYFVGHEGHDAMDRYGRYLRVSPDETDRASHWFRRWGEHSVMWGRLLPVLRSIISIPAGFAEMDVRKFVVYTTVGALAFNLLVTGLVYVGRDDLLHLL